VEAKLQRGPKGGRKPTKQKRFEEGNIVYEHQMTRAGRARLNNHLYAAFEDDEE